ncbi:MAG: hypothetical protein GF400_02485 [Candidatus Eisenbacteria bacterium]|nr:hypothetical protein [Candidatus Eisenbacteria bacterium]
MRAVLPLFTAVFCFLSVCPAVADWDLEDPHKWVQYPDLREGVGMDVMASWYDTTGRILADDFLCTETGAITEIHVWGSWFHDYLPYQDPLETGFTLSIHGDVPADTIMGTPSYPDTVLWYRYFEPGEFTARVWNSGPEEGWFHTPSMYIPNADTTCWQYNFRIPESEAFVQQGDPVVPLVYWLDVQAYPEDPDARFGWKSAENGWNDAACWSWGVEPDIPEWRPTYYPDGHELSGESVHLAFVIVTGSDEFDFGDAPDPTYKTLLASNGARHAYDPMVYLGNGVDVDADGQPDPDALGDDNDGNDDEDAILFIDPLVAGQTSDLVISASTDGYLDGWIDFDGDGTWAQTGNKVFLSEPLTMGLNFLTVAVPPGAATGTTFMRLRFSTAGGLGQFGPADDGEVEDWSLSILESHDWKWVQAPDLDETGIDVNATLDYILADDFECNRPGRVTDIFIWGSWEGDYLPHGEDPTDVEFTLSLHRDIPESLSGTGYSMPGPHRWVHTFLPGEFEVERYQSGLAEGWLDPPEDYHWPGDTVCWLYKFHLPHGVAFHQTGMPDSPKVYWLDVQAVPGDPQARFGWKSSLDHWNDDAVWGTGIEPYTGPWYELRYPPGHPMYQESIDMAFALEMRYGTEVPDEATGAGARLQQNAPNPFSPSTRIAYSVPSGGTQVELAVFTAAGRRVRTLVDDFQKGGEHAIMWDGRDEQGSEMASGIYFCRMVIGDKKATRKMVLLR